jgi:nucleotide-binding universal stress UspA family protein
MENLKTVVVGVDFTAPSRTALLQAIRIAGWSGARVKAAYVLDTVVTIEVEAAMSPMALQVTDTLVKESLDAWRAFAARVPGAEKVPFHCEVNNRGFGFVHYLRDAKADLVMIGAYADRPDTGFGTMAAACVRHGPCDTLIVREGQTGAFTRVVVGVDFSPTSLVALERAVRIATQDGAAVDVVHVYRSPWRELAILGEPTAIAPTPAQEREYEAGLASRLKEFATPLEHELGYLKARYIVHADEGHRSGLAAYAETSKADLLVLGTRGRTNLRDMLLGSTAEKTLRHAKCSVLAVRPR